MAKVGDPETAARRERFAEYCRKRGWEEGGRWRVVEIGKAINRKTNQVNNLFNDDFSFGPTIARALEAELDLPKFFFDGAAEWPFSRDLQRAVEKLSPTDLFHAENMLRGHLKLDPLPVTGNREAA